MKYSVQAKSMKGIYTNYHFEADSDVEAVQKISDNINIRFNFDAIVEENSHRRAAGQEIMSLVDIFDKWQEDAPGINEILYITNDSTGNMLFMKQEAKIIKDVDVEW